MLRAEDSAGVPGLAGAGGTMQTEIYESDPFTARKGAHLGSIDTDYRFERNDEFFLKGTGGSHKYRVIFVRLDVENGRMRRELQVLKI
jgi:hypothetical protein